MKTHTILCALVLIFAAIANAQTNKTENTESPKKDRKKTEISKTAEKVKLPAAADIFDRHVKAAGGRAAIEKIKSRQTKGTVEMPAMGLKGTFEMLSESPNKSLVVMNLDGFGEITEAFDGQEAWSKNPIQGLRVKTGQELEEVKESSDFYYDLNLAKIYPKAVAASIEKADDKEFHVVKADADTTFYFDTQSGLMTRVDRVVTSPQGKISSITKFEDHRMVDGVNQTFLIRQSALGSEFVFNVSEIKHNVDIDDARFSKPK